MTATATERRYVYPAASRPYQITAQICSRTFTKHPSERYEISHDFTDRLPPGRTLATGAASAIDTVTGANATSTVIHTPTETIAGASAAFTVKAGTSGITYRVTSLVTLDNGDTLAEVVYMVVKISDGLHFTKHPSDQFTIGHDFTDRLPPGRTIASGAASAVVRSSGGDATATVIGTTTEIIDGNRANFQIKGGSNGVEYRLTSTVTLDNGDTLVETMTMMVRID